MADQLDLAHLSVDHFFPHGTYFSCEILNKQDIIIKKRFRELFGSPDLYKQKELYRVIIYYILSKLYKDETFFSFFKMKHFKHSNRRFESESFSGTKMYKAGLSWVNWGVLSPNSKTLSEVHFIGETSISGGNSLILLLMTIKH